MSLWEAVFCGVIQGLTEFLPVSSSGHLSLAHTFFGISGAQSHLSFDILLHLATLAVVFIVYHRDVFDLCKAAWTVLCKLLRGQYRFSLLNESERMAVLLVVATVPLAGAFFLKDSLEMLSAYPAAVGGMLIVNGILLLLADCFSAGKGRKALSVKGAFGIGLFQLLASLPGISRSGSTISGGMLFGLSRENAVKFSFLMSIPAIVGANIANVPEMIATPVEERLLGYYLVGMAAALIFGFAAMKFLSYISSKEKFGFFAYYCIAIGMTTLLLS
jgi:undecaprenyl-diphosphatase